MDQRDRQNLAVAIVAVVILVGGYWLMSAMHRNAQLEECLLRRRLNCEQIAR